MRYIFAIVLLTLFVGCKTVAPLKGLVTAQAAENLDIKAADSINAKIAENLEAKMVDMQNANLKLIDSLKVQIQASVKAMAGFNNKIDEVKQTAGRDANNNSGNTNDTGLMQTIFKYWYLMFFALIGLMKWQHIQQIKENEKDIKRLESDKKFYKEKYITEVCKDQADLNKLRSEKEQYLNKVKEVANV